MRPTSFSLTNTKPFHLTSSNIHLYDLTKIMLNDEFTIPTDFFPAKATPSSPSWAHLLVITMPTYDSELDDVEVASHWLTIVEEYNPLSQKSDYRIFQAYGDDMAVFAYSMNHFLQLSQPSAEHLLDDPNSFVNTEMRFFDRNTLSDIFSAAQMFGKELQRSQLTMVLRMLGPGKITKQNQSVLVDAWRDLTGFTIEEPYITREGMYNWMFPHKAELYAGSDIPLYRGTVMKMTSKPVVAPEDCSIA